MNLLENVGKISFISASSALDSRAFNVFIL